MNSAAVLRPVCAQTLRVRTVTGLRAVDSDLSGMVYLTARRHVDYGRVRSAMCPA
jgi:hypothetical protein